MRVINKDMKKKQQIEARGPMERSTNCDIFRDLSRKERVTLYERGIYPWGLIDLQSGAEAIDRRTRGLIRLCRSEGIRVDLHRNRRTHGSH